MTKVIVALACLVSVAWAGDPPRPVPCKTIDDCWLAPDGHAVHRPKRLRGKKVPRGNCGDQLYWLRNQLSCDDGICKVEHVGDKC